MEIETRLIKIVNIEGKETSFRIIKDSLYYQRNYISFYAVDMDSIDNRDSYKVDVFVNNIQYIIYGEDLNPVMDYNPTNLSAMVDEIKSSFPEIWKEEGN